MMHKLILFLFLVSAQSSLAQTAYYDALFCASVLESDVEELLSQGVSKGDAETLTTFQKFLKNPFDPKSPLPDFERTRLIFHRQSAIADFASKTSGASPVMAAGLLAPLLNLSSMSGSQVDTALYGLTLFFADAFRREYLQTYLQTFDRTIGSVGELEVLFPTSYAKLRSFDPARYKDLGNELKLVFDDDLSHALPNLIHHIESAKDPSLFPGGKNFLFLNQITSEKIRKLDEFMYIKLTADVGQKLIEGVHPGNIISYVANGYPGDELPANLKTGVAALNIIQDALRDTTSAGSTGQRVWLTSEKLGKLNTNLRKAYFTAILYRNNPADITNYFVLPGTPTNEIRDSLTTRFTTFDQHIKSKIYPIAALLSKIDDYSKLKGKDLYTEQNFLPLAEMMGEVMTTFLPVTLSPGQKAIYQGLVSNGLKIYNGVRVKNYANLPLHITNLFKPVVIELVKNHGDDIMKSHVGKVLDSFGTSQVDCNCSEFRKAVKNSYKGNSVFVRYFKTQSQNLFTDCNSTAETLTRKNFDDIKTYFLTSPEGSINHLFTSFTQRVDHLAAFTSGVVSAKTSEDVSTVIKQFAAPATTAIDKRQMPFSITLSGMPGLYLGMSRFVPEQLNETFPSEPNPYKFVAGLSLPVGFDFSFSLASNQRVLPSGATNKARAPSLGFFIGLIDLGAMLNYRLATNSTVLPVEVPWQSILSPGATLLFGFPNTPLTLGAGYQYGPQLRKFSKKMGMT